MTIPGDMKKLNKLIDQLQPQVGKLLDKIKDKLSSEELLLANQKLDKNWLDSLTEEGKKKLHQKKLFKIAEYAVAYEERNEGEKKIYLSDEFKKRKRKCLKKTN